MPTPGQSRSPIIRIDISINHTNHNSVQKIINNIIDMNSKGTYTAYTNGTRLPQVGTSYPKYNINEPNERDT